MAKKNYDKFNTALIKYVEWSMVNYREEKDKGD